MNRREVLTGALAAAAAPLLPKGLAASPTIGVDLASGPDLTALVLWGKPSVERYGLPAREWRALYVTKHGDSLRGLIDAVATHNPILDLGEPIDETE